MSSEARPQDLGIEELELPLGQRRCQALRLLLLRRPPRRPLSVRDPGTFSFAARGGFGLILFTPWTTLDDLEINLGAVRRPGVDPQGLRADIEAPGPPRERPLRPRARRDGILVDSFEGFHYYDFGCPAVSKEMSIAPSSSSTMRCDGCQMGQPLSGRDSK